MTSPWGAIIAGLGGAAGEIGTSMDTRELRTQAMRKAAADAALKRLIETDQADLVQTTPNDPTAQMSGGQQAIAAARTPDQLQAASDANPNVGSALQPLTQLPDEFGNTLTYKEKPYEQTKEGKAMAKLMAQQGYIDQRAEKNKAADFTRQKAIEQMKIDAMQPKVPTTRPTANGIEQWNPDTKTWDIRKDAQGHTVMPFAPPVQPTIMQGQDPSGQQHVFRIPKAEGAATEVEGIAPKLAGGGDARSATQIAVAANQAVKANSDMKQYEDDLLSGKEHISATGVEFARKAYAGSLGSAYAEKYLNENYPRLAAYVKSAKAIGVAERLITPRGGSNYLTQAETALSGVGPNPTSDQISQSRAYREALVGGLQSHVTPTDSGRGGKSPAPTAAPSSAQSLWDAAVAKYGQAKVLQEYGPRPD